MSNLDNETSAAAAERIRKSEAARAKRKAVKETVTTKLENEYAKARRSRKNKQCNFVKYRLTTDFLYAINVYKLSK